MLLAIESSCDETSAAVLDKTIVLSNVISSQLFHTDHGGVIPELASRAHLQSISAVVREALVTANINETDLSAIAVTTEPGLIGSLLVGSNFAKGLALRLGLPIIPVHHIEGHLYSGCLEDSSVEFPFVALVVSGGHTSLFYVESYSEYQVLGSTRDDAAGEAFDKVAKLLGLGYPGGPLVDALAQKGNSSAYSFPRSMLHDGTYNFSFSGLKTSVRYFLQKNFHEGVPSEILPDICASVQQAITDVLVAKAIRAAIETNVKSVVIAGGVSANSRLRKDMNYRGQKHSIRIVAPRMSFCMDNAAMIGFLAEKKFQEQPEVYSRLDFRVQSASLRAKRT
ncbi:MAG: tRNA (adenosine(37)-N6)-threonylcarbamoyltransferase complex transferase subunit TsaD [Ignavibacteriae bacterium]|nr:tRNA (adenosine(37)-N6)-threonylcarbamoyltransferase complex transferase subunit TsaD [Ignavibacteriota bacterium]